MTVEKLITDHIDIWSSALQTRSTAGRGSNGKIDLYGIKKLRELILELAVRGKLVPQDPNDEPASELLKRIAVEKAELVKQGKIKKQKPLPEISEDEKPYELPEGWEWVRLGNVGVCSTGKTPSTSVSSHFNGNIPFVGPGQITQCGEITQADKFLSEDGMLNSTEANNGDIFTVCIGGSIGKSAVVSERVAFNQQINSIKPVLVDSKYIYFSISTTLFISSIVTASTGSATPIINRSKWESLLIPCAPVAEQHSIVAKVNELMALCDQLEQQSLISLEAHQQLVETLLATLVDSQHAEDLTENWARISQHFDTLFTTEASIDALKQTILQLAVMGKLVPQDPNDEPASELLKRIEQEKALLVKEGKIKKQKPLPPINDEEKPFELPKGWEWCRLGHCIHLISGQHLKPNEYTENIIEGAIPYITGPAEFGDLNPTYSKFTIEKRAVAEPKDILVTCKGAGLGKLNVVNVEIAISRQLMAIRTVRANCDYFKLLLSSMYDYFQGKGVGIAIPGISREDVIEPVISLPPLNEQERIVSRVNALFGTCDHLKSRLKSAQQTQLHLADALTDAALN
ncbi:restriction endonuclease subunit S [Klebsiella pneumoniae]|uniref:restriction endonuclease subunit S n=1 Tax=Klebsiella pneumoniae TaxID=573 RepID=UPI0025A30E3A|nr:restriction endonuclease subunit S [Klebsiella pneumoniae]MCF0702872.1 restriction endonuclease subunit S [Klebsiella pneumoniae]MDM7044439.1 restriction endonuclease subunit S [Klebsiella pneumoniae]